MTTGTMITPCDTIAPIVIGRDGSVIQEDVSPKEAEFFQGWQPRFFPDQKDERESERVGRKIRAVSKQCWFNARQLIQRLDAYADASYVEGYAVSRKGWPPLEHGWVVKDGLIIDPTLPDSVAAYFPGLEFVGREGIEAFLNTTYGRKCRKSPFLYAFGWGGQESPSMVRAYNDSVEYFRALHQKE